MPSSEGNAAATVWIAEKSVVFVRPDGSRAPGRIAVAAPVQLEEHAECWVHLDGLAQALRIYGDNTLQALMLGLHFLGYRLHDLISTGGRVLKDEEDTDVLLAAYFGPLLQVPA